MKNTTNQLPAAGVWHFAGARQVNSPQRGLLRGLIKTTAVPAYVKDGARRLCRPSAHSEFHGTDEDAHDLSWRELAEGLSDAGAPPSGSAIRPKRCSGVKFPQTAALGPRRHQGRVVILPPKSQLGHLCSFYRQG